MSRQRSAPDDRPAVLLVGNYLPSLAAARALARAGHRVIAGDGGEYANVTRSRSCHEVWVHPPAHDREAFLAALLGLLAARPDIRAVLPLRPDYVALLADHRDALPAGVAIASPQPEVVRACLDKERMLALAVEVGAPVRPTRTAHDRDALLAAADATGYPCVVRPADETGGRLSRGRKAAIVADRADLERQVPTWPAKVDALIVQSFVDGPRHNVHFLAREGRILARYQTTSPRTDRIDGTGLGVETTSVADDPRLVAACDALVGALGYTGAGLVQFLVPASGEPHFLELNPRHGSGIGFAIHEGLDLVTGSVTLAATGDWTPPPGWRTRPGRRHVWTSRDLFGLMWSRAHGDIDRRGALRWLRRTVRAGARAHVHATWRLSDPMPSLVVYAHLLRDRPWRSHRNPGPARDR